MEIEYYFIGSDTWELNFFSDKISEKINVSGVIVSSVSSIKIKSFNLIDPIKFLQRSRRNKVYLVDFHSSFSGITWAKSLEINKNIKYLDYIELMSILDMGHIYEKIKDEQLFFVRNFDKFQNLRSNLTDEYSRSVLDARLNSYAKLSRFDLIKISLPGEVEYFNGVGSSHSHKIANEEIYVDIGAADGDTVLKFNDRSKGLYKEIHAFEPDSFNYKRLEKLKTFIPNLVTHHNFVGPDNCEVKFYEDSDNRQGSNIQGAELPGFNNNKKLTIIKQVKLDDVLDNASLIKMDVEGYETKVIEGANKIIKHCKPTLAITCYHYPQDLLEIYESVMSTHVYKYVKLRHFGGNLFDTSYTFSDYE
jgi:FkbM family methyltransferase